MKIENVHYVIKIIELAQKLGAFWELDQSEDNNGSVKVCAPLMVNPPEDFFRKRVYDYKTCYDDLCLHFKDIL